MFNVNNYNDWEETYETILTNIKWFPKDTIIKEYKINNSNLRADFVISINKPLAVIEIKVWKIDLIKTEEQVIKLTNCFNDDVEWYVVFFDNEPNNVKFYKLNKISQKLENIHDIPNYSYFKLLATKSIYKELNESNKIFNFFSPFIWILMIFYHIFLVYFSIIIIDTNELIILLVWIWLIFLPFFSKIKIASLELERIPKSEKNTDANKNT